MLTLIKRELEDHIILFLLAAITSAIFVLIITYGMLLDEADKIPIGIPKIMYSSLWFLLPFLPVASAGIGATQMYSDRNTKIAMFLATKVTREKLLAAKIVTGILWLSVVLGPPLIADMILLQAYPRLAPVDYSLFVKIFTTVFLTSFACYALGLQMGWNLNKFFPILGSIALSPILISVIIIKGFGFESMLILLSFTVVLLIRIWQKFMLTPL